MPRKRKLKDEPEGCLVVYKGKSKTFDSQVFNEHFLNRTLHPHMLRKKQDSAMLVWDQANPHKTAIVKENLKRIKIENVLIDKGCTAFEQPADAYWFGPMKKRYNEKWTDWMLKDPKSFTKNGNMKSPGYVRVMKWVIECWNELDRDLIRESFDGTGITCSNEENFNSILRYVLKNGHMPGCIVQNSNGGDDLAGFNQEPDNDTEEEESSSDDSSSDKSSSQRFSSFDECEIDSDNFDLGPKTSKKTIRNKSNFKILDLYKLKTQNSKIYIQNKGKFHTNENDLNKQASKRMSKLF